MPWWPLVFFILAGCSGKKNLNSIMNELSQSCNELKSTTCLEARKKMDAYVPSASELDFLNNGCLQQKSWFCASYAYYLKQSTKNDAALLYADKSCQLRNYDGCWLAHSIAKDYSDQRRYMQLACTYGDREGCSRWTVYLIKDGSYNAALPLAEKLCDKDHPEDCYNLACLYSLQGKEVSALNLLETLFERKFIKISSLVSDPDFNNLKQNDRFKILLKKIGNLKSMNNFNEDGQ
ncbi:MAG: hypothetical protein K2P81_08800 [Bacteriovoracaceae bacterium]|nr:hypothetical protein [Bacteriovoracaceae bacterium]